MSDLQAAIQAALQAPAPPMRRVPIREPEPLCVCRHREVGHASGLTLGKRCLNCDCRGFRDSGQREDPEKIPYRLVPADQEAS